MVRKEFSDELLFDQRPDRLDVASQVKNSRCVKTEEEEIVALCKHFIKAVGPQGYG